MVQQVHRTESIVANTIKNKTHLSVRAVILANHAYTTAYKTKNPAISDRVFFH